MNFTSDRCVRYEAAFAEHNSENVWCPMLIFTPVPSKHLLVFKTSSRHVLKTSSIRLQRNNFSSSKTSWRCLGRRKIVTVKTSWRRLEDVLKTCLEDVCKTSLRQTKCFLELSLSNKSKCISNKSGISQIYIWRI